ncbi:MAG: insulinase family protein, partial [Acidaminococcaceae bacterium]|nr:insulinase family protein [Acidaminococcaceae bacterium]
MDHERSGARLLYLANDDDNKVFSIGFRTPPSDDTGVAHILEHSTLCGSRKYHLKEPFVELVKGSLNTFLNAMTYPDKTVYPVASRNDKDFRNLMDVYLDAVFYPLIYDNSFTLKQEGWHYELENADAPLQYNGVVYNEMKGVYSSPDSWLEYYGKKLLFPDTTYRFESGGLPSAIPSLTQKDFLTFHKTFYSPENSYIYLYGDMDIEETLAFLDGYLKDFRKTGRVRSEIALQQPLPKTAEFDGTYPVPEGAPVEAMTFHEVQIVAGDMRDQKTIMALRLLENV